MKEYCGKGRSACATVARDPHSVLKPGNGALTPAAFAVAEPTRLLSTVTLCATVPNAVRYFGLSWLYCSNCVCRCELSTPLYPISATIDDPTCRCSEKF